MPIFSGYDWWYVMAIAPLIGSFINVVALRLPEGGAILFDRSRCRTCDQTLGALDLIPILSWVCTKGRCRYCASHIGISYPAIEVTAMLAAGWAAWEMSGWQLWLSCGLAWTLITLSLIDWRYFILPNELTLPLIPTGLAVGWLIDPALLTGHVAGSIIGYISFAAVGTLYKNVRGREGLGRGDAKLLSVAGAWLSWEALPGVVLIAALTGLILTAGYFAQRSRISLSDRIPFGPCICFGIWVVWLYGPVSFV